MTAGRDAVWFRVADRSGSTVLGLAVEDGIVVDGPPVAWWWVGLPWATVERKLQESGWRVEMLR